MQRLVFAGWAAFTLLGCGDNAPSMRVSAMEARDAAPVSPRADAGPSCSGCLVDAGPPPRNDGDACGNGLDDDENGKADDDCDCSSGTSQRCFTGSGAQVGVGACKWGVQQCTGTASGEFQRWGECVDQVLPVDERCGDKADNDCDGEVDEDCGECEDGTSMACSNECGVGERICRDEKYTECSAPKPSEELCNGVDDDCDGAVDDIERSCTSACGSGLQRCVNGGWGSCSANTPTAETCDGLDEDCDGSVDERLSRSCSSTCGSGVQSCVSGRWGSCSAAEPRTESCNGVDDDCDGAVDDLSDQDCSSACGEGTRSCEDGAWSSCSAPQPSAETCNLQDDDCDGDTDEGLSGTWSFENVCSESRIFLVIGGCNVCAGSCNGYWVEPGDSHSLSVDSGECVTISAFARTPSGDECLEEGTDGEYVGETREICAILCIDRTITMEVTPSC